MPHEPITVSGLADGCDRCAEIAENPTFHLDKENLQILLKRTLGWEHPANEPRSYNERLAMIKINAILVKAGKLYAASPERVVKRLMEFV